MAARKNVDDFEAEAEAASARRRDSCAMGRILQTLDPDLGAQVARALRNENITAMAIRTVLEKRLGAGVKVPAVYTIQRHRKSGGCACEQGDS
jgi:hypothetical protein